MYQKSILPYDDRPARERDRNHDLSFIIIVGLCVGYRFLHVHPTSGSRGGKLRMPGKAAAKGQRSKYMRP